MASNPMQRKANISFLLGMLITLIITGIVIAFLIMQLTKLREEMQKVEVQTAYGYVVSSPIKSGETITPEKLRGMKMNLNGVIPKNIYPSAAKDAEGKVNIDNDGNVIYKNFAFNVKAKIDMDVGTILSRDLTYEGDPISNDLRIQEYNVVLLPTQIEAGEYVDVRLRTPNGADYIVVSHKQIELPQIDGVNSNETIWVRLTEEEILTMSGAIVEAYMMNGSVLYATRYVEAGYQQAATPTYVPPAEVVQLMNKDTNIVNEAMSQLKKRYDASSADVRNNITKQIDKNTSNNNVISGVQDEITRMKEERKKYLQTLGG